MDTPAPFLPPELENSLHRALRDSSFRAEWHENGFYVEGDTRDFIAEVAPLIWNAALAAARQAILDDVYIGRVGTDVSGACGARDEALTAVRHLKQRVVGPATSRSAV